MLVMTTNHPEKLDPALLRPGRVDLQIEFTFATSNQIRNIYLSMYGDTDEQAPDDGNSDVIKAHEKVELEKLAERFSMQLPANVFSPAEIQGFLLERRDNPEAALQDTIEWVRKRLPDGKEGAETARVWQH